MKRVLFVAALLGAVLAASNAFAAPVGVARALPSQSGPASQQAPTAQSEPSVGVIVRFRDPATAPLAAKLLADVTSSTARPDVPTQGIFAFRSSPTDTDSQYSMRLMLSGSGIQYAEPNYVRNIMSYTPPTDPAFTDTGTWYEIVNGVASNFYLGAKHWWLDAMTAPQAWPIGQGSTYPVRASANQIPVAVLDTGMFLTHPDLNGGTIVSAKDECASYNPNTDVFTTDNDVTPDATSDVVFQSHGTATSAAIGAEINGVGMVGIGYQPIVLGYKVAGPITSAWQGYPAGSLLILDTAAANGIYDAVAAGAKVINMSFGGPAYSQTYQDAITYAHAHGVVVCCSAGNDGGAVTEYPAACTYATAVAALCRQGGSATQNGTIARASFSDYASGVNDLAAPGEMFWDAYKPGVQPTGSDTVGYQFWAGTSFSSPAAAGAIAYLWRAMPDLTNDQIVSYVENSAAPVNGQTGRNDYTGYGLVDMRAAYNKMIADYPTLAAPTITTTYARPSSPVTWTASSGYGVSYLVSVDGSALTTASGTSFTLPALADGQHLVSVLPTSTRNWNSSSLATKTITIDSVAPVVSNFALNATTLSWSVTEANPYSVQAYVDTATPATVASNTLSTVGLSSGSHTLHVNATDAAGNSSGWVSWPFSTAPLVPAVPSLSSVTVTDALAATVSWPTVNGATSYDFTLNGGSVQSTAGPSFLATGLAPGVIQYTVRSVAGTLTSDWATATITDNVVVPGTPVISAPANVATPSVTATWAPAANARSYEYRLNGGASSATSGTTATFAGLPLGSNAISVRSLDNFSASDWATATVTYAVTPPVVASVVVTDALSATVGWSAVAGAASYDYTVNGGSVQSTPGPSFVVTGLAPGAIPIQVRTVRSNGDVSAWATATITDNVVVPGTPVISAPANVATPSVTATWAPAANARSYEYRLNGGASSATSGTTATFAGLPLGSNAISVRSLDNFSASDWATVTVTYAVPAPVISAPATVWASTATVTWTPVPGATSYEYAVNGGGSTSLTATGALVVGLTPGPNTLTVRALQGANASAWSTATITWAPPSPVTLTLSPPSVTVEDPATSTVLSAYLSAPAETFQLQSSPDGSTWSDLGVAITSTSVPAPVPVTVPVTSTAYFRLSFAGDNRWAAAASGVTTATYLPAVQAPSLSSMTVTDTLSAVVSWPSIAGAAGYDYQVNGGSVGTTPGASFPATGLQVGGNTVSVRTVDGSARRSAWSTATVTVALLVPDTPLLSAPATVGVPSVAVSWPAASGALGYEFRLDGGSSTATQATSVTLPLATEGTHTVEVRSLDNLSQSAWASASVSYAVPAPLLVAPTSVGSPGAAVSWFAVPEATAYQYSVNGGPAATTTATGFSATGLNPGANTLEVRALQGANASKWVTATIDFVPPPGSAPLVLAPTFARVTYPAATVSLGAGFSAPNEHVTLQRSFDGGASWQDSGVGWTTTATPAPVTLAPSVSRTTWFRLVFAGDSSWLATTSPVVSVTYLPRMSTPKAPSSARRRRAFSLSDVVNVPVSSGSARVTFVLQRWQKYHGRLTWVTWANVRGKGSATNPSATTYKASASLPSAGFFRVYATYSSALTYGSATSGARSFRVR